MKHKKSRQVRIRITQNQYKKLVEYLTIHSDKFKNQSDLIRESITKQICRTNHINSQKDKTS